MSEPRQADYEYSLTLPATPDRVWAAWTDAAALRSWFAESAEVTAEVGGAFRFWGRHTLGTPSAEEATQRLERVEAPGVLAFAWTWCGVSTRVELSLEAEEWKPWPMGSDPPRRAPQAGCKLTVRQSFEGTLPFPKPENLVDDHWRLVFGNLFSHLEGEEPVLPDYGAETSEVRHSLYVAAPPAAVFRALTEPAMLNRWIASDARVDARVGGGIDLGWGGCGSSEQGEPAGDELALKILAYEPDRLLTLSWPDWRGQADVPDQEISWRLEPEGEGTRVDFAHTGFVRVVDRSDYQQGWAGFLEGLVHVASELSPASA